MCEVARSRSSRTSESTSGVEREPGDVHAVAQAAAHELVDERAQVQVGVGRCHGSGRWPPTSSCSTGSPRRAGAGSRSATRSRDGTGRSPRTSPATATFAERRPASFAACDAYLRALVTASRTRSPATRWAAGSRCTRRSRSARGVRRLVLIGASPGLADAGRAGGAGRGRRRARRPHRGDRDRRVRARMGRAAAVRGHAARGGGARRRRPAAQHRGRARRGAARARHGRDAAAVGPAGRARRPRRPRGRGARREVPRDRRADGGGDPAARDSTSWPAPGHAVHLEAPDAVVELLAAPP